MGRYLLDDEHVDHIDNNKKNDEISNLQILTQKQNNEKEASLRKKAKVVVVCDFCLESFEKEPRQMHKKNKNNYCSRTCFHRSMSKKSIKYNSVVNSED